MRLIDADKIGLTDFEILMCNGDYKEALKMLLDKIENAPTVVTKDKCKWEYVSNECTLGYFATDCGKLDLAHNVFYKYCPYCGKELEVVRRGGVDNV